MPTVILVCTPALNSRLRHWASDEDGGAPRAHRSASTPASRGLRALGIDASGEVGDANPLQAMEDELRTFGADEIIISTHPEGRSNWLERGVVEHARERFTVPIRHVVVDLDRERAEEAHSSVVSGRRSAPPARRLLPSARPGVTRQPLRDQHRDR